MADLPMSYRERVCNECGIPFRYEVKRGADRRNCSAACRVKAQRARWRLRERAPCTAPSCGEPIANLKSGLCHAHHAKLRRKGHIEAAPAPPVLIDHSHGYKMLYSPNHPLTTPGQRSRVYEHRAVYHAAHGGGPFDCHWCGTEVSWGTMHVDHVDDDKANNPITNLVASCPACNQVRGQWKQKRAKRAGCSRQVAWHGRTQSVRDWADELGIPHQRLRWRFRQGWSVERAMSEPRRPAGRA